MISLSILSFHNKVDAQINAFIFFNYNWHLKKSKKKKTKKTYFIHIFLFLSSISVPIRLANLFCEELFNIPTLKNKKRKNWNNKEMKHQTMFLMRK